MKINVYNSSGKVIDSVDVDKNVVISDLNNSVVRQSILSEMTNLRQGTHSSKNRSAVRGGGKKPWKQKGRGVARAGTIRSPLWKGGGVVFGPEPHKYSHKLPKKISRLARKSILSKIITDNKLVLVDELKVKSNKTSTFIKFLENLQIHGKKILILVNSFNENLILSSFSLGIFSL